MNSPQARTYSKENIDKFYRGFYGPPWVLPLIFIVLIMVFSLFPSEEERKSGTRKSYKDKLISNLFIFLALYLLFFAMSFVEQKIYNFYSSSAPLFSERMYRILLWGPIVLPIFVFGIIELFSGNKDKDKDKEIKGNKLGIVLIMFVICYWIFFDVMNGLCNNYKYDSCLKPMHKLYMKSLVKN